MKKSTAYLSDSRPELTPFDIDCGRIPAYRYHGTLQAELKAGTLPPAEAVAILEDMLIIREMEEMIVKLRSGAYEPIRDYNYRGPTHVSIGQEGTAAGRVLRAAVARQHHQHASRPWRKPGQGHRRHPPDDRRATAPARAPLPIHPSTRTCSKPRWNNTSIAPFANSSARTTAIAAAAAARCTSPISPSATSAPTPSSAAACPLPPARPWPTAISSAATWFAALPATAPTPTAWCWNRLNFAAQAQFTNHLADRPQIRPADYLPRLQQPLRHDPPHR